MANSVCLVTVLLINAVCVLSEDRFLARSMRTPFHRIHCIWFLESRENWLKQSDGVARSQSLGLARAMTTQASRPRRSIWLPVSALWCEVRLPLLLNRQDVYTDRDSTAYRYQCGYHHIRTDPGMRRGKKRAETKQTWNKRKQSGMARQSNGNELRCL